MSEESVIEDAIRKNAAGPKSAEVDGQKVECRLLPIRLQPMLTLRRKRQLNPATAA